MDWKTMAQSPVRPTSKGYLHHFGLVNVKTSVIAIGYMLNVILGQLIFDSGITSMYGINSMVPLPHFSELGIDVITSVQCVCGMCGRCDFFSVSKNQARFTNTSACRV